LALRHPYIHGVAGRLIPLETAAPELLESGEARALRQLIDRGLPVPQTWVVPDGPADPTKAAVAEVLEPSARYVVRLAGSEHQGPVETDGASVADAVAGLRRPGPRGPVVVQAAVEGRASGLAFSRNPMTGLDEVVVEIDSPAGETAHADRWVHRWGAFVERPGESLLPDARVEAIVAATRGIAGDLGRPVELEWAWDGREVWWTAVHPIAGIEGVTVYSNRISKEVMPGIIKPLVWSINVPLVNRAWIRLFTEAIGPNDLRPDDLARAFAYRSYFNMTAIGRIFELLGMPRDSLELLIGIEGGDERPSMRPRAATIRKLPRMLLAGARIAGFGVVVRRRLPRLRRTFDLVAARPPERRSDRALLRDVAALEEAGTDAAYLNIVAPLLANLYTRLLRHRLEDAGIDFASFDLTAGMDRLEDYDPDLHLARLGAMAARLADRPDAAGGYAGLPEDLKREVDRFIDAFGHLSDSGNDFSVPAWREDPDLVAAMVLARAGRERSTRRTTWDGVKRRIGAVHRPLTALVYRRARSFVFHREAVSSAYTFGYGLFRPLFLELGRRLTDRGVLEDPGDVMYLSRDEVEAGIRGDALDPPATERVESRKAEIDRLRDVVMPEVIFGEDFEPVPAGPSIAARLSGVPTSRGHHIGTVRVVHGVAEFERVEPGDVVAIPYSDVAWAPLFARAGAVVAESGGMLSHSSITAREYGIPCVVSVDGAMQLPDGAAVSVDGYTGEIVVLDA
jgi:pyruvate,water dikinase